jgi:sulfoquinovosidase
VEKSNKSEEIFFFSRSAWNQSPKYTKSFWLGDQLESWDSFDGINSVIFGHFSSGILGHSLVHSDIGGYTVVNIPPLFRYVRTKELL